MEQIVCCAALLFLLIGKGIRYMRAGGRAARLTFSFLGFLAGMGLAGYMEYYVQRHGGEYVFAYNTMAAGLTAVFIAMTLLLWKSPPGREKNEKSTRSPV